MRRPTRTNNNRTRNTTPHKGQATQVRNLATHRMRPTRNRMERTKKTNPIPNLVEKDCDLERTSTTSIELSLWVS